MTLNLLDKLDSINVQATDKISTEDKKFISDLKKNYGVVIDQLSRVRASLQELKTTNRTAENLWESSGYGSISVKNRWDKDEKFWGARYMFTFKYSLKYIKQLFSGAKHNAIGDIISYFNQAYILKLDSRHYTETIPEKDEENLLDIDHVVDWVLTQTGGLTLQEMGVKILKEDFTGECNGRHLCINYIRLPLLIH